MCIRDRSGCITKWDKEYQCRGKRNPGLIESSIVKTIVYRFHEFERSYFERANAGKHELRYLDVKLSEQTASLSKGFEAASLFVSDDGSENILKLLHENGIRFLALRSAGFNNVDLKMARQLGMRVARVPAYSPYSVA